MSISVRGPRDTQSAYANGAEHQISMTLDSDVDRLIIAFYEYLHSEYIFI